MLKRAAALLAAVLTTMLGTTGVASAQDPPPNEAQILAEEIPHIAERSVLYSLPPDPDAALEALSTFPQGAEDVIGMHLGRLYPTPHESTPGVAPLLDLLQARAGLATDPQHWEKKAKDTSNGEVATLLLPIDATTAIVIMPTEVVESDPQATPLPERRVDLSDLTYEINGETRTVEQYMKDGQTNAVAFMHDGEYIFDAYQNGFRPQTRHQLWSATKSVTTALVGIAVEEGLVDSIHDPIEKYIPEAKGTDWEGTTLKAILQMQSGMYWVDVPVHQPEELVLMGMDFHTNGLYGMTRDEYLVQLTRVSEPGKHYRYNSSDTQMLAWLLENVYDESYSKILSEKIWQPAGMESEALIMVDREGHAFASMGLFVTAKDAARFGELFRNGGRALDGTQVVPKKWVEASTNYTEPEGGPRGYQWMKWSHGYTAQGFGTQRIAVAPDLDMVGVRFGNDPVDSIAPKEFEALYLAVAEKLGSGGGAAATGGAGAPGDDPSKGHGNAEATGNTAAEHNADGKVGGSTAPRREDAASQQIELAASVADVPPTAVLPFLVALGLTTAVLALLMRRRLPQS